MIVRGTTPTIDFKFKTVKPEDVEVAYLTIKQKGVVIVEKDLTKAIINNDIIGWALSQEDTLNIDSCAVCEIQIRYRLTTGEAGASPIYVENAYEILKTGVI